MLSIRNSTSCFCSLLHCNFGVLTPLSSAAAGTYFDGTTLFANPSTCTAHYRPTNPPLVIDLPLDPSQPAVLVQGPATGPVAAHVQYAAAATDVQG